MLDKPVGGVSRRRKRGPMEHAIGLKAAAHSSLAARASIETTDQEDAQSFDAIDHEPILPIREMPVRDRVNRVADRMH